MAINDHFVSTQSRINVKFRELLSLYKEFTSIQRVEMIFCLPVWIWIWMIITNLQWKSQLTFTKEFECWNIRSQDYSFHETFVPMMELSFSGPFVPWNIRSLDHSFPRPKPNQTRQLVCLPCAAAQGLHLFQSSQVA